MSATLAKQFEGFAKCCLDLARSTKTATHRVRFVEMAHEYWLASLLIRNELSSDLSAGHAYHNGGTNWPSKQLLSLCRWRRARQPGCRAPIPRPENLGDTSRVPWRKLAKYQKPRRGCRRGFGWQYRGGCCQSSRVDSGDRGGRAVQLALTI